MYDGKHERPKAVTGKHILAVAAAILVAVAGLLLVDGRSSNAAQSVQKAAAASGLICSRTDKSNGGFVLDCNPSEVSPSPVSPSPSFSSSPSASPTTSSPSPSPSSTLPPSPSSGPTTNCVNNPTACGFPNANNTGPTGSLTVKNGNWTYTVPNQTVTGVQFNGCVTVTGANITFKNVFFNGVGCFNAVKSSSTNLRLEDVEITCGNTNGSSAVSRSNVSVVRADIHNCENGFSVGPNVVVTDSWIHDLIPFSQGQAHSDGAQFDQDATNVSFVHNFIDARGDTTSAIIMWDEENPQNSNVAISNNLMAGGSYTLYCPRQGPVTNIVITLNRFGTSTYGHSNGCTGNHVTTWGSNVDDATGQTYVE